jgi:phosphomevalonate kinase
VLLGEYAVLEGAPALSMAVDRYARVVIEPCAEGDCGISADTLDVAPLGFEFGQGGELHWDVESPAWPVLERTASLLGSLHAHACMRFGPCTPYRIAIDTQDLYMKRLPGAAAKLGLGSSSAVAVALDAGLRSYFGGRGVTGLSLRALKRMLDPYRRGQSGNGSGIDLATSLCGGVIRYRIDQDSLEPEVSSLALPDGLTLLFVWSGTPASTPKLVDRFRAWRRAQPVRSSRLVEDMIASCEKGQRAIERSDADALVEQIQYYGDLMGTIGTEMGVAIVDQAHAAIKARAEGLGAAYKPCGAGGGDLGMAAATDSGLLHDLERWLEENGYTPLALTIDAQGVEARPEPSK